MKRTNCHKVFQPFLVFSASFHLTNSRPEISQKFIINILMKPKKLKKKKKTSGGSGGCHRRAPKCARWQMTWPGGPGRLAWVKDKGVPAAHRGRSGHSAKTNFFLDATTFLWRSYFPGLEENWCKLSGANAFMCYKW
jgi:hypothetical protein